MGRSLFFQELKLYINRKLFLGAPFKKQLELEDMLNKTANIVGGIHRNAVSKKFGANDILEGYSIAKSLIPDEDLAALIYLVSMYRKHKVSVHKVIGADDDIVNLAGGVVEYLDSLYINAYKWQKNKNGNPINTKQPVGLWGYINDSYRISENGVMQTNKGDGYFSNMAGRYDSGAVVYHLSNVGDNGHLFIGQAELVVAFFYNDSKNGKDYFLQIDEDRDNFKKSNIKYTDKSSGYRRTRAKIYEETGVLLQKVKGEAQPIKEIKRRVPRRVTDELLRTIKKHGNQQDWVVIYHNDLKRLMATTKTQAQTQNCKVIVDCENLVVGESGKVRIGQEKFYVLVNRLYDGGLSKTS